MLTDIQSAVHRFSGYAERVIAPARFRWSRTLPLAAFQCREPVPEAVARDADYRPVPLGWTWGPAWSTCWFRVTGRIPDDVGGHPVALRFCCGTEALLWRDGVPHQGFDHNRELASLHAPAAGGERFDLLIEAACNHGLGTSTFWWDTPDSQSRWRSTTPGRVTACALVSPDDVVEQLWIAYDTARRLLAELDESTPRARQLVVALAEATRRVNDADVAATAAEALEPLDAVLRAGATPSATSCIAVGHAHIDTAWLWPLRETRRKCVRSFASVLRLMERFPDFRFLCSQAQQYAWVEEDAPALFAQIRTRVEEGRWEPSGAMWIEPDANVPSGESLVRQILAGTGYWQRAFGTDAPQRLLYLPDTFGFTAALPQIMALAGLDTFVTNKLSWNERNPFPHASFRWRGLDGTEVLAHQTPGHDYNAALLPNELRRGETNIATQDRVGADIWLQPFGYGDGGGGPTAEAIQRAQLAGACEGLPRVTLGSAAAFSRALHTRREELRDAGRDLPVWDGELYLELHRGTLTSQAWLKRANRNGEEALRAAEWLALTGPAPEPATRVREELDEAWKLLLLNQFHDILPGTSIAPVYAEARRQHERIADATSGVIARAVAAWADAADTSGLEQPMLILNPHAVTRGGVVDCEGTPVAVRKVSGLGATVVDRAKPVDVEPVHATESTLANGLIEVEIDDVGRIAHLRRAGTSRAAGARTPDGPAPLNQLVLYEDRPRSWDAWDIDAEHREKAMPVTEPVTSRTLVESSPLRAAIEVTRLIGARSAITQRYVLAAGSPRLDIVTHVRWHESHRLLRALFPVDVRSGLATYEIQFGHLTRPTHANTSWDEARFEVCGHRWMDHSEPGFGVALLNDGIYGHSCHGNVMGLSLLRASSFPDPDADRGEHRFTYSVMPHGGDWRAANVDREAHALNTPLITRPLPANRAGSWTKRHAPLTIETDGGAGVVVSAIKPRENGDGLVVRLVETHGGAGTAQIRWGLRVRSVRPADLLERPRKEAVEHTGDVTTVRLRAFQIVTLVVDVG
ncbi:MAG: alpha-mannosidase [Phycisphaerales bacterium]|nr:alpha-mannosidase [Phycisphaerae bacterium]NNF44416.1 alpha-mannosidase [Phycisphaerales bacterium]NNM26331.1 alpha-mannosidase [Phycisphaerales bacterium]